MKGERELWLEKRVEELEREKRIEIVHPPKDERISALNTQIVDHYADAMEWRDTAERAKTEVERLHNEIARPKYETLRQLADAVERNEQLKAEVARLRGLILEYEVNSPGCQSNLLAEAHRILARR